MSPLKITMVIDGWLAEPEKPLYLDSLLASQVVANNPERSLDELLRELPLEREVRAEGEVWKASAFTFEVLDRRNAFSTRVTDRDNIFEETGSFINSRKNKISTSSGPLKNYARYTGELWVGTATAYCVGDKKTVLKLLSGIEYLGKSHKLGLGAVKKLSVEEVGPSECQWYKRATPWKNTEAPCYKGVSRIEPPYFRKEGQVACYIPKDLFFGAR